MSALEWIRYYFFYPPPYGMAIEAPPSFLLTQTLLQYVPIVLPLLTALITFWRVGWKFKRIGTVIGITAAVALVTTLACLWFKSAQWRFMTEYYYSELRQESEVLQGAKVTLHKVVRISPPKYRPRERDPYDKSLGEKEKEEHNKEIKTRDWYLADVTVTPQPNSASPQWNPAMLTLVDARTAQGSLPPSLPNGPSPKQIGSVKYIDSWQPGGHWKDAHETYYFEGKQRLRLTIGVEKGTRVVRFCYRLEILDRLDLPPANLPD